MQHVLLAQSLGYRLGAALLLVDRPDHRRAATHMVPHMGVLLPNVAREHDCLDRPCEAVPDHLPPVAMIDYDEQFRRAERAARQISDGNEIIFHELMRLWRQRHPEPINVAMAHLWWLTHHR
jgi:hypothetical protein